MAAPTVTVAQGQLKGRKINNYLGEPFYSFQGIPYAKPPVGELRFKAPQPIEKWNGIYDATKEGPECPSIHMILGTYVGQEDKCLHVNVYTRQLPEETTTLKPVMVYIHGGGFTQGSNRTDIAGPEYLLTEDIVLVVVNYRLNVLGFLSLEDDNLDIPGNAGLKDQVMALQWVKNNIKSFSGNPDSITIFGESAGGASIHYLLLSPLTKGLFHRAIMMSGCALNFWAYGMKGYKEICQQLGHEASNEKEALQYLSRVPAKQLVNAADKSREAFRPSERRCYGPVIEKPSPEAFISDFPERIIESGNYNKVPLMVGYTSMEGFLFEIIRKLKPEAELPKDLSNEVSHVIMPARDPKKLENMANEIQQFYYGGEEVTENNIEKTILLKSDTTFIYDIYRSIKLHQKTLNQPIFLYRLTVETALNNYKKVCTVKWLKSYFLLVFMLKYLPNGLPNTMIHKLRNTFSRRNIEGVSHADDLNYLFKMFWNPKITLGSIEDISIRRMVKLWTNFAKCGNPTLNIQQDELIKTEWPPTDPDLSLLEIGRELNLKKNPDMNRMLFWDKMYGLNHLSS